MIASLLLASVSACAKTNIVPIEGAEREQVLAKAEPIADSLFQGMREHDYNTFARDFDATMKKAMDENGFQKMMQKIDPVIGKYQSRQVAKVEKVNKYIAVTYTTRYELEDAVSWRIMLTPGDSLGASPNDAMLVSGLWYDSPKLRAK